MQSINTNIHATRSSARKQADLRVFEGRNIRIREERDRSAPRADRPSLLGAMLSFCVLYRRDPYSAPPVLLRVDSDAGHGIGSSKQQRDLITADQAASLLSLAAKSKSYAARSRD